MKLELVEPTRPITSIPAWRAEIDEIYGQMRALGSFESEEIFIRLAGWSARVSEIRSLLVRQENRAMTSFRTREIDPLLEEIDRQFKTFSRIVSVRELEFRLSGGAP